MFDRSRVILFSLSSLTATALLAPAACKRRIDSAAVKTNDSSKFKPTVDANDLSIMFARNKKRQIYPLVQVSKSWAEQMKLIGGDSTMGTKPILRPEIYQEVLAATTDPSNFVPEAPSAD